MRLSNLRKFFPVIGLVLLSLPACRVWQTADKPATLTGEAANALPFSTKTPDVFQTRVAVVAGTVTQKYFIARARDKWRTDYAVGEPGETSIIYNGAEYYVSYFLRSFAVIPLLGHSLSFVSRLEPVLLPCPLCLRLDSLLSPLLRCLFSIACEKFDLLLWQTSRLSQPLSTCLLNFPKA